MTQPYAAVEPDVPTHLVPSEGSEYWRGAYTWIRPDEDGYWQPWRLPPERARRAHAPDLIEMAKMAAGIRVEFRTDADAFDLPLQFIPEVPDQGAPNVVDLTVDGHLTRVALTAGYQNVRHELPAGLHEVCLWLPQAGYTACGTLTLAGATETKPLRPRTRWITYGSSISQCHAAVGPSRTWPATAATALDWDLTCLGFSGQCQLDPIVERAIAGLDADVITLCLGINSYNASAFNERTFAAQVSGFIERVREAHPRAPIVVITPVGSPERERTSNEVGLSLAAMRDMIADAVAVLQAEGRSGQVGAAGGMGYVVDRGIPGPLGADGRSGQAGDAAEFGTARADPNEHQDSSRQGSGDPDLHLIDGRDLIAVSEGYLLHDGLHPSAQGYQVMGERMAERLTQLDLSRPRR